MLCQFNCEVSVQKSYAYVEISKSEMADYK